MDGVQDEVINDQFVEAGNRYGGVIPISELIKLSNNKTETTENNTPENGAAQE